MRLLGSQGPVQVVSSPQMVAISEGNDGQLIMRRTRGGIDQRGQIVVSDSGSPVAVLADKFGFAVSGEVTQTNKGRMARLKDTLPKSIRNLYR